MKDPPSKRHARRVAAVAADMPGMWVWSWVQHRAAGVTWQDGLEACCLGALGGDPCLEEPADSNHTTIKLAGQVNMLSWTVSNAHPY